MNDTDVFYGLQAIAIAHEFWRGHWETVERRHVGTDESRHINDGEMFTANVRFTRIILRHLRDEPVLDFEAMVEELQEAMVGDRTLEDLLGPEYAEWEIELYDSAAELSDA